MARVLRITDAAHDRVKNPFFSEWTGLGIPTDWIDTGSPTITRVENVGSIESLVGAYTVEVRNSSSQNVRGLYQDITTGLIAGKTYYVKVRVKPVAGNGRLYAWDGGTFNNPVIAVSSPASEWQELIVQKEAGSGGIRIGLIALVNGDRAYFDLVQLATFHVELIDAEYSPLFRVTNWEIQVPDFKGSGTYASSALAEGRRLIDGVWGTIEQAITFHVRGDADPATTTQIIAESKLEELFAALQAARNYQKTSWLPYPVYVQYKSDQGSDFVYALLINARIPQLGDVFTIDYAQLVLKDLDLEIEHSIPTHLPPGAAAAVLAGNMETYNSQAYGNIDQSDAYEPRGDFVFVGNKHGTCNITNMHLGTGGANLIGGAFARAIVANGTTTYFGINTSLSGSGPFTSIVLHISRAAVASTATGQWQLYTGSAWVDASAYVYDSSNGFTSTGWHVVSFYKDLLHAPASPGGSLPTGWWIRYVVTGNYTTTAQIDREIFTANWNYINIPPGATFGSIEALAGIDGISYGATAAGRASRVVMGLRSLSRGASFRSVINLGNVQNDANVSVAYSGMSAADPSASGLSREWNTGMVALHGSTGAAYAEITLNSTITPEYVGEFRVFLDIHYSPNSSTTAQLTYGISAGLPYEENEVVKVVKTSGAEIIDLGLMRIDPDVLAGLTTTSIKIRINVNSTSTLLTLSRIFLIPVDEYSMDSGLGDNPPGVNSVWSPSLWAQFGSVRYSRAHHKTLFSIVSGSWEKARLLSRFITKAPGPMILQTGGWQRLHFVFMNQGTTSSPPFEYHSNAGIMVGMRLQANYRYFAVRGD